MDLALRQTTGLVDRTLLTSWSWTRPIGLGLRVQYSEYARSAAARQIAWMLDRRGMRIVLLEKRRHYCYLPSVAYD